MTLEYTNISQDAKSTLRKMNKLNWTSIKIKNFRSLKESIMRVKREPTESEKIPDEGVVSII